MKMSRLWPLAALFLAAGLLVLDAAMASAAEPPPLAPVRPVIEQYYGTDVRDDYRYLENLEDPQVQAWMKAQSDYTRSVLDALPGRAALLKRVHELFTADIYRGRFVRRGQRYFYETWEPGAELPKLHYRDGLQGAEHLLLDPAALGKGTTTHYALDYYEPSWDGRLVAYAISAGGSEQGVIHVMDVETGKILNEAIDRTMHSVITWRPDNRSFFYPRYPKPTPDMTPAQTHYNARTYLHTVNVRVTGDGDPVVFGRGVDTKVNVPEGQGTYIVLEPSSPYAIAVANHNMDDNPSTLFVAPLAQVTARHTQWRRLADVEDGVTKFALHGDRLYFLTQHGASHFRLLSVTLTHPDLRRAQVIVPEGRAVITNFAVAREGLYVRERDGAASALRRVSFDGAQSRSMQLPFEGNVFGPVTDPREAGALFNMQGWVQPPRILSYDPATDQTTDTGLVPPTKADLSQVESKEVFAVGHDGTRIPLSISYRKGLRLDGSHPTILDGYGSYGTSMEPYFDPMALAWIERGGVLAVAHARGGGEYGEDWHRAGQKLTKLNTILDFIACAEYLVAEHYTSPKYLAGEGGSAGGITVGGALTWRPDLFSVILDEVGMSDTLRFELTPNGPPNISEFGSVKTEEGFHGLYAMGAYFHVRNGTAYPAVMFTTGVNDPRMAPWEMTKMAARVQAATSSGRPVLLRIDYDAGHGIGSTLTQYEIEIADEWSFALWQMGDPEFQLEGAR